NAFVYGSSAYSLGNLYLTGRFMNQYLAFGNTILTNLDSNTYDIYIIKFDPGGNVVWGHTIVGTSDDWSNDIIVSTEADSIYFYVTGFMYDPVSIFDTIVLNQKALF